MSQANLYPSNPPKLVPSFVCHVDILGYQQLCQSALQSSSKNEADKFLRKVRSALNQAYDRVREKSKLWRDNKFFEIKIFTDNIVVGYPINDFDRTFGEAELGHIFDVFGEFQLGLAMEGFLVRGGIACGYHYMDEEIVFGDALIEAVKQDTTGGAPKISLAPSATKALQKHLGFYKNLNHAPQLYDLLEDADDSIFINYLQNAFSAFPNAGIFYEVFEKHKETLTSGLKEFSSTPGIRSKYEWAARYHNSVIDNFLSENTISSRPEGDEVYLAAVQDAQKLDSYKINIESLAPVPSKLTLQPST
jgi:hypothetical protein